MNKGRLTILVLALTSCASDESPPAYQVSHTRANCMARQTAHGLGSGGAMIGGNGLDLAIAQSLDDGVQSANLLSFAMMRVLFLLSLLALAACISDPNDNGEEGPRPGYEQCMAESGAQAEQDARALTGGNRVGGAMAGSVGAVFTAPVCLFTHR